MTNQDIRQQATLDLVDELVFVLDKTKNKQIGFTEYQERYGLTHAEMRSLVSGISHDPRIRVTYQEQKDGVTKVACLKAYVL